MSQIFQIIGPGANIVEKENQDAYSVATSSKSRYK